LLQQTRRKKLLKSDSFIEEGIQIAFHPLIPINVSVANVIKKNDDNVRLISRGAICAVDIIS
jgi:hypothetical protein